MEWTALKSSNLKEVSFDTESNRLEIIFTDGGRYCYTGVPESIFRGLLNAPSAGRYFNQKIRAIYPATRM